MTKKLDMGDGLALISMILQELLIRIAEDTLTKESVELMLENIDRFYNTGDINTISLPKDIHVITDYEGHLNSQLPEC